MDPDEIDLAILDLYEYGEDYGISATQMMRRLQQAVADAYLVISEIEDERALNPMPSISVH